MDLNTVANMRLWLPGYAASRMTAARRKGPLNVWLTIADHYEPYWRKADRSTAMARVKRWRDTWPAIAERHADSAGRPARYTFFYAEEEYDRDALAQLAEMASGRIADVEVHIHHDGEGEANFLSRMRHFLEVLHVRHRLLHERDGKPAFGFIHGNWALDNSRPDGRWCGLNNELLLLKQLGCYADFTLPTPNATQTAMVNTIYWATDDPHHPKSHNRGTTVVPGGEVAGDLLIVPGPLGFNFRNHRWRPSIESGELASYDPPARGRAHSWVELAPRVGNNIFIKLFTHGTQEANSRMLLEGGLDRCLDDVHTECAHQGYPLYFASAWEMYEAIDAVRRGVDPVSTVRYLTTNPGTTGVRPNTPDPSHSLRSGQDY